MPITEPKDVKRKKFRVKVKATWHQDEMKAPRSTFTDNYLVTCGEKVTGRDVWKNEHDRVRREHIPEGAVNASIVIDVDPA